MGTITLNDLLLLAATYANLGWAVQEQAEDVLVEDAPLGEQNDNALDMIVDWLNDAAAQGVVGARQEAERIETYLLTKHGEES